MKFLFSESQSESLINLFDKTIQKHGLQKVLYRYKLSMNDAIRLIGDLPINRFTNEDLYELCVYFVVRDKKYWNEGLSDGDFRLTFEVDSFVGTINTLFVSLSLKQTFELNGMATPYWDASSALPIDFDYFLYKIGYDITGDFFERVDLKNKFQNLGEVVQWLYKDYPFVVFEENLKVVKEMMENL